MLGKRFQIDENGKPTRGGSYYGRSEALCREWKHALVSSGRAVLICMGMNVAVLLGSIGSRSAGAYPFHINSQFNVSRSQASAQTLVIKELSRKPASIQQRPNFLRRGCGWYRSTRCVRQYDLSKESGREPLDDREETSRTSHRTSQWTIAPSGKAMTMRTTEKDLGGGGTLTYSVIATRISGARGLAGSWKFPRLNSAVR